MKIVKRVVALLIIITSLVAMSSCFSVGIDMAVDDDAAYIVGYYGNSRVVYIPTTYHGKPVSHVLGKKESYFIGSSRVAKFEGPVLERVYFPWSVHSYEYANHKYVTAELSYEFNDDVTIIFTACDDIIYSPRTVIPLVSYNRYIETGKIGYAQLLPRFYEIIPANIAYMFNYPDAPNENYFFIDLVERNAWLTEPPYIPEREGFVFDGWYKEEECLNAWDFETDFVEIKAEKGKRIYEEIRLYAKWAPVS